MCIGIPMQIVAIDGTNGVGIDNEIRHDLDLSLVPDAKIGDFVLTFLGAARHTLEPKEAAEIGEALNGLRAVFNGENPDEFFKDLIDREPQLPPHMLAAMANGQSEV